jgi:hypothetical protein
MNENLVGNSTILEPAPGAMALGGGAPVIADIKDKGADDYKPQSVADVLTAEAKRLNEEEAAEQKAVKDKAAKASEDAKAKVSEKEQAEKDAEAKAKADRARANDGKFAKAEKTEGDDGDEAEQDGEQPEKADEQEQEKSRRPRTQEEIQRENEKRRYSVVAERFTPEARAKWDNVPHPVKAELFRLSQERDTEVQRYRQSHERYEQFRQFDEIARTNGRDLRQSLEKVVAVERALAANPISGLDMILREVGPRRPDGQPLSLYEVAQHIVSKGPQAYQQMAAQPMMQQPQQRQPDPEIAALRQELAAMKTEQTVVPVVNSFAQSHPDFEQLAPQIKAILESKVIDGIYGSGLSYEQKLSEAYRMAGGRASMQQMPEDTDETHSEVAARPVNPDAGKKSVRGAPSNGADTATDDRETDLREMLRKEMRKLTA